VLTLLVGVDPVHPSSAQAPRWPGFCSVRDGPDDTYGCVPRITRETPIGPDADLAQEDLRLADGTRLTPEVAEDIVEQVRRTTGRPSLSGTATSPQIAFRVAATLRERAAAVAAREGKTISQLAREALEERIAHPR